jgi:capsular polysaccharide biosynthesis protein
MALSRNISNEELFENKLREIGFNVIHTEDLNIEEKVQIFKSARLVVAIHGAGLTNILTMNVDSIVIELIDKRHFSHCYKALAKILALNYFSSIMKVGENGMPYIDIENSIELIKSKI